MTKPIIDKTTGQLKLANDFIVDATKTPNQLLNYFGQTNIEIRDVQTGWKHYSVRNLKVYDNYFIFTFLFEKDILKRISFVVDNKFITGTWADWSKEKELQKQAYYNDWLTKEVGNERKFSWGTIASYYDDKSGGASISLKYA